MRCGELSPMATPLQKERMRTEQQREYASRLVAERMKTPIRSLAGQRQTQVDRLLARAEEQMHKAQYYRAAEIYGGVAATVPDNALAWLGRANALLAAGEYVQAYVALEQGIERFPQLLTYDLDLPSLVGNREILDIRRAEIEKTLAGTSDYRLGFLLGYLEYYSGQREAGLRTMQKAVQAMPAGSILPKAYQELVSQTPASQPAGGS